MKNSDRAPVDGVLHASVGAGHFYSAPGGAHVSRQDAGPDGTAELAADGEFDMDSTGCLRQALSDACAQGASRIRLDVGAVAFADSTFLHVLLRAREGHAPLVLVGPVPHHLHQLLDLTGTAHLFSYDPLRRIPACGSSDAAPGQTPT
ncbi:STAS domain-containing protein [Streptomyces sp. NPDC015492]|uniref:STAS domain-containing protein n=1 Tax=Streptomyces sp. NPDC015492 TaxID=3364958 RepID=UPI00370216A1